MASKDQMIRAQWQWFAWAPEGVISQILPHMWELLQRFIRPPRKPERSYPRAVKNQMNNYPRKRRPDDPTGYARSCRIDADYQAILQTGSGDTVRAEPFGKVELDMRELLRCFHRSTRWWVGLARTGSAGHLTSTRLHRAGTLRATPVGRT
ncbi:MAG: hypothetical protein MJE77_25570 [Proteobacteria bacterium]|nr:hypothetical protein [Pseudomonadota bacterium]